MNYTFGTITQPFIKYVTKKKNTCVLALVIFYETRHKNATKSFRVLSCVIYTIIDIFVCIGSLDCQPKRLSIIRKDRKYLGKSLTDSWVL